MMRTLSSVAKAKGVLVGPSDLLALGTGPKAALRAGGRQGVQVPEVGVPGDWVGRGLTSTG